jgi:DNA invertase Pin-like site-specific DNA recombinase
MDALQELEALGAGLLVVAKWDRLGRDVYLCATIERLVERLGAQIQSADGAGNGSGPEQMLMRRMLQAFAEYERALIRSRTRAALRAKRARMERAGGIPLGCHLAEDGRSLETNLLEELAVSLAKRLHDQGKSLREIAAELKQQGFKPRGQRWHPQTVARMIAAA